MLRTTDPRVCWLKKKENIEPQYRTTVFDGSKSTGWMVCYFQNRGHSFLFVEMPAPALDSHYVRDVRTMTHVRTHTHTHSSSSMRKEY